MGTICAHPNQKDECNETVDTAKKNFVQLQGTLGTGTRIELVIGHYRQQRAQNLLILTEAKHLSHCQPIKEYSNDCAKTIETIQNSRKTFYKGGVHKGSPYRRLLVCVLPVYRSEDREEYSQLFQNILGEALVDGGEVVLQLTQTMQGVHCMHNQLILAVFLKWLAGRKPGLRVSLVTTQKKMMSMYRFELMKTEQFKITE